MYSHLGSRTSALKLDVDTYCHNIHFNTRRQPNKKEEKNQSMLYLNCALVFFKKAQFIPCIPNLCKPFHSMQGNDLSRVLSLKRVISRFLWTVFHTSFYPLIILPMQL